MTEENMNNWMREEAKELNETTQEYEEKESLQFVEDEIVSFEIQFEKGPFPKWKDEEEQLTKKIIPVLHNGIEKNLWLNVKNPLYCQIIKKGAAGIRKFDVKQKGTKKKTRYVLIE